MQMTKNFGWRLALVCAALLGGFSTQAGEPATGFAFAKEGNRYVGEQCKDQVVQIRSAMSGVSMAPEVWWVVYYDPTATLKSAEVKFVHGKMADVKRPMRLLEPIGGNNLPLDRDKLKTDSDQALATARALPELAGRNICACQFWLERKDAVVCWKVRLWATRASKPSATADLGDVYIASADGKVFANKLRPERAD
jgi:hypothetical protein